MKFCTKCGTKMNDEDGFCPICGTKSTAGQESTSDDAQQTSPVNNQKSSSEDKEPGRKGKGLRTAVGIIGGLLVIAAAAIAYIQFGMGDNGELDGTEEATESEAAIAAESVPTTEPTPEISQQEKLQGTWLLCGRDGNVSDGYREIQATITFHDLQLDLGYEGEVFAANIPYEFVNDKKIEYYVGSEENSHRIAWKVVKGVEMLVLSDSDASRYYEKIAENEPKVIYLNEALLDEVQGYWLFVGSVGEIYDDEYIAELATLMQFDGGRMNQWGNYEEFDMDIELNFDSEDSNRFEYLILGQTPTWAEISFGTVQGTDVLIYNQLDTIFYFKKTTAESYAAMGGKTVEEIFN